MHAVSTLSVHGHITSPKMMLSVLLSDALTTKKSQCWLWKNETTSIPYIVNQYAENPDILVERLESALDTYFKRYLEHIKITVKHNAQETNLYTIVVNIHAVINEQTYFITDDFLIKDSMLSKLFNSFNGV